MKAKALLVLVGAALVLSGCSSIHAGKITNKHYEPPSTWVTMDCKMYRTDSKGVMTCAYYGPTTHYSGPDWRFDLQDGEKTGWVHVDETTYNQYAVGDWYGTSTTN
jgi:hypothetical protein